MGDHVPKSSEISFAVGSCHLGCELIKLRGYERRCIRRWVERKPIGAFDGASRSLEDEKLDLRLRKELIHDCHQDIIQQRRRHWQ